MHTPEAKATRPAAQPASHQPTSARVSQADQRPGTVAQRHLLAGISSSPPVQQATTLQRAIDSSPRQQAAVVQRKANKTGLPDQLKAGVENLSGHSLDDVRVHYNSAKPAQLQAHAYAQGTSIHVAPGQEKHLPHEAWHVVQQKQGRVKATRQLKSKVDVNDDAGLEKEADVMGGKALQLHAAVSQAGRPAVRLLSPVIQRNGWDFIKSSAQYVGKKSGAALASAGGAALGAASYVGKQTGAVLSSAGGAALGAASYVGKKSGAALASAGGAALGAASYVGEKTGAVATEATGYLGMATGAIMGGAKSALQGAHPKSIYTSAKQGAHEGYYEPGTAIGELTGTALGAVSGLVYPLGNTAGTVVVGGGIGNVVGKKLGNAVQQRRPLKTMIIHLAGHVTLTNQTTGNNTNHQVGKKMIARLDAQDVVQGSATDANWTWMQQLRSQYRSANVVRGHLLNHDLGGFGMPDNLYPISTKANRDHSTEVEQKVKGLLDLEYQKRQTLVAPGAKKPSPKRVIYSVEVREKKDYNHQEASFMCSFGVEGESPIKKEIKSNLGSDFSSGFGGAHTNPLANTPWAHGTRKGFEKPNVQSSLVTYNTGGKVKTFDPKRAPVESNKNAKYKGGSEREVVDSNLDDLGFSLFNPKTFVPKLTDKIIDGLCKSTGLQSKSKDLKEVLKEVLQRHAEYGNSLDNGTIRALIIKILKKQVDDIINVSPRDAEALQAQVALSKY